MANSQEMRMILSLIEDIGTSGTTSILSGASMAQSESEIEDYDQMAYASQNSEEASSTSDFSALELRLATRFIELVGGPRRVKELLEKIDECQRCLGVDEQLEQLDSERINALADMVPNSSDLPTSRASMRYSPSESFASLYNPNADMRPTP